ncbi:MAG: hypothetical protein ABI168_08860 [Ginsengibacter sp.]|jgi:hypothetical protein
MEQFRNRISKGRSFAIKGRKNKLRSPFGSLNSINLAAIPINIDSTFGKKYNLHILGTTAEAINYSALQINKNTIDNAYLFGGIDYDEANISATCKTSTT